MKIYSSNWLSSDAVCKLLYRILGKDLWLYCKANFGYGHEFYYVKVLSEISHNTFKVLYCGHILGVPIQSNVRRAHVRADDIKVRGGAPEVYTFEELSEIRGDE